MHDGECAHELWVDDRELALVERDEPGGRRYKIATGHLISATAEKAVDGCFDRLSHWQLNCPHGAHQIRLRWRPRRDGYHRKVTDQRQKALNALAVPVRRDDAQGGASGRRSTTESFHNWYEAGLAPWRAGGPRAARLDPRAQQLDMFGAALLWNSITFSRSVQGAA
jgi:hypothetical protein